jgi:hypothetical protein
MGLGKNISRGNIFFAVFLSCGAVIMKPQAATDE